MGRVRIDLHTHSDHSDGTDPPADLVAAAAAAGLDVVALTDHDVASGWAEAGEAARAHGLGLVPGIEISCRHRGFSVHLLAYLLDPGHPELRAELDRARTHRSTRLQTMTEGLQRAGFPIDYPAVLAQTREGATVGRPHLADALVAAGRYPDREAAFADVLHAGSPYYVSHYAPAVLDAVPLVRAAGGVAVLAHPFAGGRGRVLADHDVERLTDAGLQGLEVWHRDHGPADVARAAALADRLGLLPTGSSDYHGAGKPNRLGEHLTAPEVLERLLALGSGQSFVDGRAG